jgi:Arc/MetJ family transcription regulator
MGGCPMPTNLAIDDRLIEEARKVGHHGTKKEAVTAALDEYIRRRKQMQILDLFDTIDYQQDYNYKANRRRDQVESER